MAIPYTADINARRAGSMNDRIDFPLHDPGNMLIELRDSDPRNANWLHRLGWKKSHQTAIPAHRCIGAISFRNTAGILHWLSAWDNGVLYHAVGETCGTWTPVTVQADVAPVWDMTYIATFHAWRDDCFITFWQPPEVATVPPAGTQNLRFDSLPLGGAYYAYGVSLAAPALAPAVADGGAGNIAYGTFDYFVTFVDDATGWESDRSPLANVVLEPIAAAPDEQTDQLIITQDPDPLSNMPGVYRYFYTYYETGTGRESPPSDSVRIVLDDNADIILRNITPCPEPAGVWNRRIYRSVGGAPFYLVQTIVDNTTVEGTDVLWADGAAYAAEAGRQVAITNIPVSASPGRVIYRNIYRSDNGATPRLLYTLADNVTVVYADNNAAADGIAYTQYIALDAMGFVTATPDGVVIYGNDRANALPARIVISHSDDYPEAYGDEQIAGTHDDPITGISTGRDGTIVTKRRAIHYMGRQCKVCERIIQDVGSVGQQTNFFIDTRFAFLSPEGPRLLTHYAQGDVKYVGMDSERFCLADTWADVVKERLPYATGVHWRAAGLIIWGVQMCSSWPLTPPHNDTAIVWDYGSISAENPGGNVFIMSLTGWDCGFMQPVAGAASDVPFGAFALGFVGQMFEGEHGDGTNSVLTGTVLAFSGSAVTVDTTALGGENVVGSVLYLNSGTGTRICRPTQACENARALITAQCGGQLTTAGELTMAVGDGFWIGGFPHVIDLMIPDRDPDAVKKYTSIHVQMG